MIFSNTRNKQAGFGLKKRLKALGIHLIISLIIFFIILTIMLVWWYPAPHFTINNGWQGVRILILVDLVIGPLLTFFLFNPKKSKKELKFDLSLIAILQIAMLWYGISRIESQRPLVIGLTHEGVVRTAIAEDVVDAREFYEEIKNNASGNPPFVFVREPKTDDEREGQMAYIMMRATGIIGAAFLYEPMTEASSIKSMKKLQEIVRPKLEKELDKKTAIDQYEKENGTGYYFFPFYGETGEAIVVITKKGILSDYIAVKTIEVEKIDNY